MRILFLLFIGLCFVGCRSHLHIEYDPATRKWIIDEKGGVLVNRKGGTVVKNEFLDENNVLQSFSVTHEVNENTNNQFRVWEKSLDMAFEAGMRAATGGIAP